jgi:hypothetical protein
MSAAAVAAVTIPPAFCLQMLVHSLAGASPSCLLWQTRRSLPLLLLLLLLLLRVRRVRRLAMLLAAVLLWATASPHLQAQQLPSRPRPAGQAVLPSMLLRTTSSSWHSCPHGCQHSSSRCLGARVPLLLLQGCSSRQQTTAAALE